MAVIKKIGVWSLAKMETLLMAFMGLIMGIIAAAAQAFMPAADVARSIPEAQLGYSAIIILPLMYAAMGFIAGLLGSLVYNFFASLIGGVEVEFEDSRMNTSTSIVKKRK